MESQMTTVADIIELAKNLTEDQLAQLIQALRLLQPTPQPAVQSEFGWSC